MTGAPNSDERGQPLTSDQSIQCVVENDAAPVGYPHRDSRDQKHNQEHQPSLRRTATTGFGACIVFVHHLVGASVPQSHVSIGCIAHKYIQKNE